MRQICVVEDDPATMRLYYYTFRNESFSMQGFGHAQAALDTLSEREYDLFLLDVDLPDMSGLEMLSILRGLPQYERTPVVMVTARDCLHNRKSYFEAGVTDLFAKPFSPSLLRKRITEFLSTCV